MGKTTERRLFRPSGWTVRLLILITALICPALAFGQSTTVTGTIQDANGQAFVNGTWTLTLVSTPGYVPPFNAFCGGSPMGTSDVQKSGTLDASGNISTSVCPNNSITPVGTLWSVSVCPASSSGCTTQSIAINGASFNLGTAITPPAISVVAGAFTRAYQDSEVIQFGEGSYYWNILLGVIRVYHNGAWQTIGGGGTCSNTLTFNASGSGVAPGTGFNCSANVTVSYNSIGAAPLASPTFTGIVTLPGTPSSGQFWGWNGSAFGWFTPAGGSMTWPVGGAGIPNYNGASGWGTTYSATNTIPANFIPTLNQNTTGTAANLSGTPALPNGTTATTQTVGDNTTKLATDAFVLANAGSGTPGGSSFGMQYNNSGAFGGTTPPTTNGQYTCGYTVTAGVAVAPTCPQLGIGGRSITGAATTDTVAFGDNVTVVTHDKAATGAVNETLPTATTLANPNFLYKYCNHSAQTDTITPTTWTIQVGASAGAASASVPSGACLSVKVDPNSSTQWLGDLTNIPTGTGTMTDGSGTSTPNEVALSTSTPHVVGYSATLPAGAMPNPSATTLGGIESLAAVTHKWINAISTSGVPAATQPACGDLSDAAASCNTDATNASNIGSGTLAAARLPSGILSCTEVWSGSGTSSALQAGDDAISNNTCYNDSGATRTITAVKCRSSAASNTTTTNPTFGAAGTGTTILSGALTCGSSYAFSATGTISSASWTTGSGIDPGMGGTLTGTSIALLVEYHY